MFETHESFEVVIPEALTTKGNHVYEHMNMVLNIPWFYICYAVRAEDRQLSSKITFLTEIDRLSDILTTDIVEMVEVYIVSPGYLNGTNGWRMDRLKEVWGEENSIDLINNGLTYVLEDDKELISPSYNQKNLAEKRYLLVKIT